MKLNICYIGIGSNQSNPRYQVLKAIYSIKKSTYIKLFRCSALYKTKPVGYLEQPDFINAVIKIGTRLSPQRLLKKMQQLEIKQGRVRGPERYGPRTLDLDLLFYANRRINTPVLTVPHPRILTRYFVLRPLAEISPNHQVFRLL